MLEHRFIAVDTRKLMKICRFVARITKRPIAVDRPITGKMVFSHESGIHCAAVLKNSDTYQPFSPEILGRKGTHLIVGRHSGPAVIRHFMQNAGIALDTEKTGRLLAALRTESPQKRSFLSARELLKLYRHAVN